MVAEQVRKQPHPGGNSAAPETPKRNGGEAEGAFLMRPAEGALLGGFPAQEHTWPISTMLKHKWHKCFFFYLLQVTNTLIEGQISKRRSVYGKRHQENVCAFREFRKILQKFK